MSSTAEEACILIHKWEQITWFSEFWKINKKGINHPGLKTWNPACLAVTAMRWSPSVWWNELRWLHSLMHSPFLSLQQQGEEEGSTEGKLLSFCFSFNDTKHLPWYSCSVQRILYIYKVQSKYPAWQRVASNPVRSLVVIIVCDCGTVSDCATDYCPLFSEKMLGSWHIQPQVPCRHYSQPCCKTPGHTHTQPICALVDTLSFSPRLWKKIVSFSTETLWIIFRVSNDTFSKKTAAMIEVIN